MPKPSPETMAMGDKLVITQLQGFSRNRIYETETEPRLSNNNSIRLMSELGEGACQHDISPTPSCGHMLTNKAIPISACCF